MAATEAPRLHETESAERRRHVRRLLRWYDRHRRELPWRAAPGARADPYRVWLSEVMLQQTTVAAVIPYFERFVARWPDVGALAGAPLDEVLTLWQGLGYYARARNLLACARRIAEAHGGAFPGTAAELRKLPGIGPYTAAAVAAIAFGRPETVVDGNVERVIARLHAVGEPLPGAKPKLARLARALTPKARAGDYAQAMMDLGATVCTPRAPGCGRCPLSPACAAFARGDPAAFPKRAPRAPRPLRRGTAWVAFNERGEVLLRRRPRKGLLGGMMEVPSSPWRADGAGEPELPRIGAAWTVAPEPVVHVFSHFRLELRVAWARVPASKAAVLAGGGRWVAADALDAHALPTVMKKVVAAARGAIAEGGEAKCPG